MLNILVKSGCYIAIIIFGYVLRLKGFFKEEDRSFLVKLVLNVTLPAVTITGFAGQRFDPAMLSLGLIGLVTCCVYMGLAWLLNRRHSKERQAFEIVNLAGYNIGTFTLPFIQSFLGPVGVITTNLFNIGNSLICMGGSYGVATVILEGRRFSVTQIVKSLMKSIPFVTCMIMIVLSLLELNPPAPIMALAEIIQGANIFLSMLLIGIGIRLPTKQGQFQQILRLLAMRYSVAVVAAAFCWFLLPLDPLVRKTLVLLSFAPIGTSAPMFTSEIKGDVGLSSSAISIMLLCSMAIMTFLVIVMV